MSQPSFAWSAPRSDGNDTQRLQLSAQAQSEQNGPNYTPTISDQLTKIQKSWDPNSPTCQLKTHFYNKVNDESIAASIQRPADDSPEEWEHAMSQKPAKYPSVPVKVKGFDDLLKRSSVQVDHIKHSRVILNKVNDNLNNLSSLHDLSNSTRLLNCKTKHKQLSKKLLKITTILSILKSKGYPLTHEEEKLRDEFDNLLKKLNDPIGLGKTNELWAKLSNLKERGKNLDLQLGDVNLNGESELSNDENDPVIQKISSILLKHQQGIQFLYETIEKDKDLLDKQLEKKK